LDHICHSSYFVAAGIDQRLHDWWFHPHPAGHCHSSGADSCYSGTKTIVVIGSITGEADLLGKEVAGRSGKRLLGRTYLNMNHLTIKLTRGGTAMKKTNIVIHYLVILTLIATFATLAACAGSRTQESTGEFVDDSVITTKVKSLLANDDFLKSFQISVETYKGIVQLSGFVNSQKAVDKATEITSSVKWVKSVKNNLVVK
jgi:hypothetical protein